jgi:uncharacterized FlgJ-related protein
MIVGVGSAESNWGETSFAHEAMHLFLQCGFDRELYLTCLDGGEAVATCRNKAQHSGWETDVYPVIQEINEGAPGL